MEESEVNAANNIKPLSVNKIGLKLGLILGGLILLGMIFYGGIIVGKTLDKSSNNNSIFSSTQNSQLYQQPTQPVQQSIYQAPVTGSINQIIRIYPSLNNHFSFYIYPADDSEKCLYGIRDKQGYGYDVNKVLGTDRITCSEGQGNLYSSFISWVDGDKFLLNEPEGEIKIVNVAKFEADTYKYDLTKYKFVGADRSLKYWLFREVIQGTGALYVLFDRNSNIVLDNINFEFNDRGALYDEVNDGFLFISRIFTEESVSVKFDFLPMSTLVLKTLLTSEPVQAPGRGCYSEYLISQPGEIILTPGCLTIGSKYLGSDGNIHIKL